MATPNRTAPAEPEVVHPDDLLSTLGEQPTAAAPDPVPAAEPVVVTPGAELDVVAPSNAVVPITSAALQAFADNEWAGFDSGLENWQHIGFSLPRILSDMRPGGGWTDEPTGEKVDAVEGIILAAMPARAWWAEEFGAGSEAPDCRSVDMERADPASPAVQQEWAPPAGVDDVPTGRCSSCPLARWNGDEPPACRERINTLIYLPDSGGIRRMTVSGTSVKHFRRYASDLQARAQRKPIFAQVTEMTLEEVDNGKMRWLEAHFAEGDPVSPQEAAQTIVPLQRQLVAQWRSLLAEELASAEADGTAVARGDAIDVDSRDGAYVGGADEEPF